MRNHGQRGPIIDDPIAYAAAIVARRKANAFTTRRREFQAAVANSREFEEWITRQYAEGSAARQRALGDCPEFLYDSVHEWGGLTEKQMAFARRVYGERLERVATRDAARAAESANAQPWTAGRQVVEVVLLMSRMTEGEFPTLKGLWKRADGAKLWCTVPCIAGYEPEKGDTIRFAIAVEPKEGDPTFAFGKRPTKPKLIARANPSSTPEA